MKVAIPLVQGKLSAHFGHCEEFALLEVDEQTKQIQEKVMHHPPQHEPGVLPQWLHQLGANIIIAGGMGWRAQQLFQENGITVIVGAAADEPEQIVTAYLKGTLQTGENLCDH